MSGYRELGLITRGSLVEGLEMKLSPHRGIEEVGAGKFVVVHGLLNRYFSLITDVRLDSTTSSALINPPTAEDEVLRSVLAGTSTYATIMLRPMLMIPHDSSEPKPVKSVPPHFVPVTEAEEGDVSTIFGSEAQGDRFFNIGTPIDMTTPVCLDLDRFVERSNGIFGKSGTGKTFLTRLVLAGVIKRRRAVNLVFDMHNEYGWGSTREDGAGAARGLRQLFGHDRVAIFSLDPHSTRSRGVSPDVDVYISLDQIDIDDLALLEEALNLNPTAMESSYALLRKYGDRWLSTFLDLDQEELSELAQQIGAHPASLRALHTKLQRLKRLRFVVDDAEAAEGSIRHIIEYLKRGTNVVLEFGRERSELAYLLVANYVSRRLHDEWVTMTEHYLATLNPADRPPHLMITIEEAHKFLNPRTARQTIFGTIARELRKYFVTLLVIDQRPSSIDDEVMSQIGTRITALLNDEKDIQSVLTGVPNSSGLRSVLASLESKQQALLLGHAVPMPITIRTRDYDEEFYEEITSGEGGLPDPEQAERDMWG